MSPVSKAIVSSHAGGEHPSGVFGNYIIRYRSDALKGEIYTQNALTDRHEMLTTSLLMH